MRYQRILLINAFMTTSNTRMLRPPAGLGYISEILDQNGIDWDAVDMGCGYRYHHIKNKIEKYDPDLIGVSSMTFGYRLLYEMIDEIKKWRVDRSQIVIGGAHVSTFRDEVLKECPGFDFGIINEGEESFIELIQGKELSEIKGLLWRRNGEVVCNSERPFIKNLDTLPFPKYRKFELKKYVTDEIPLVTSRGCPYKCTFCASEVAGKVFRFRSPKSVVDEIEYWVSKGKKNFDLVDDNFTLKKERVYQICDEIEKRNIRGLSLRIGSGARADRLDKELLRRMKEVGFNHIAIGVESGSEKVLQNLNKKVKLNAIEESIKAAGAVGMDVTLFFLIGSPGETWKDFEMSLELAKKYPVFEARFHNLVPFPGTELYNWVSEHKYFLKEPKVYLNEVSQWVEEPVFETPELTKAEREKALTIADKVRKDIIKKAIERKLRLIPFINKFLPLLLSSNFGQNLFYFNSSFRRFVDFGRKFVAILNDR